MTTQTLENLKPEAAKNGIGLGLISLVLGVISSYVLVNVSSVMAIYLIPMLIGLLLPLVISIFFCIDLRKKVGGFWNLRQATSGIFIMFLISYVISTAGTLIFTKFIEPDMKTSIQSRMIDATSEALKQQGMDQDEIDKKIEEINAGFEKQANGTVMQNIQGHVIGIILIFVFALLFGAIFKKEKPLAVFEE